MCNKPDSSPAAGLQSDSNGRAAMRLNENGVMAGKKRHVANHLETKGQRDGTLSGTAWTLAPAESENGTFFGAERRGRVSVSGRVSAAPPSAAPRPPFFGDTMFLRFNRLAFCPISHMAVSCTKGQRRPGTRAQTKGWRRRLRSEG